MNSVPSRDVIEVDRLTKVYASGLKALDRVDLCVKEGEIFALLGPNGAGKTTLIQIICGIVTPTSGRACVGGYDIIHDYRMARVQIGLVPQELSTTTFETVWNTVAFTRGLYGKGRDDAYLEKVLHSLSLWDKRNSKLLTLSGGMKRRVLIAKAIAHRPRVLFLDEPSAGVDVTLRREMWEMIRQLRKTGVTIILTTHYIEEAQNLADRIGVILGGKILLVEGKEELLARLGSRKLIFRLRTPLTSVPASVEGESLALAPDGKSLVFSSCAGDTKDHVSNILRKLYDQNIELTDIESVESSLEDVFVRLVEANREH